MEAFIILVLCGGAIGIPLLLGVLATGIKRVHRGPTSCAACSYELTGIDGKTGVCPECGGRVEGEGSLREGVARFTTMPVWVRFPAVLLLLAPTGSLVWLILLILTDDAIAALLVVAPIALLAAWLVVRAPVAPRRPAPQRERASVTLTPPGE